MAGYTAEHLRGLHMIVTGGHTYPALTTVRTLRDRLAAAGTAPDVRWVGVAHGLEARIARQEGIPFTAITTGKLRALGACRLVVRDPMGRHRAYS